MAGVGGDDLPGQRTMAVQFARKRRELGTSFVFGPMRCSASTIPVPCDAAASRYGIRPSSQAAPAHGLAAKASPRR